MAHSPESTQFLQLITDDLDKKRIESSTRLNFDFVEGNPCELEFEKEKHYSWTRVENTPMDCEVGFEEAVMTP